MTTPAPNSLPLEIVACVRRGWRLFPCNGKKPLVRGWPQQATCDLSRLQAWAAQFPGCNWAAITGPESGFLVMDFDGEAGLAGSSPRWTPETNCRKHGAPARMRLHLFFARPAEVNVRNSAGKFATSVDVRGAGGYVVFRRAFTRTVRITPS